MGNFIQYTLAFWFAIGTFYVNQRIQKMTNIKITINSLFDLFGDYNNTLDKYSSETIKNILLNEIILLEKLHDNNFYVNLELEKLKKLQINYYKHFKDSRHDIAYENLKINFKQLNKSFIILSYFNIRISYFNQKT